MMIDIVDLLHRNGTQILPFAEISYVIIYRLIILVNKQISL